MRRKVGKADKTNRRGYGQATASPSPDANAALWDPIEALIRRARKCRMRGEGRRAMVLLREACALDEWRARTWAIAGVVFAEYGHNDEAMRALKQARWLRVRMGEHGRVRALEQMIHRLFAAAA